MSRFANIPKVWIAIALCVLALAPTLAFRIAVDQGVFAYMGWRLLEGDWPYLETWESDFPGMVYLHALELLVFGKSIMAFRVFDLLFQLLNAFLIYRIAERLAGAAAGLLGAGMYCVIYASYGGWNTAQREGYAVLFLLAGYWAYLTRQRRPDKATATAIGFGFGLACLFKPTLVVLGAMYVPLFRRKSLHSWTNMLVAGAASALPFVAVLSAYWFRDGLEEIYDACIRYQSIYTARLTRPGPWYADWSERIAGLGATSKVLPLAYLPFLFVGSRRRERLVLYLGNLAATFTVAWQGTYAGYHYLPGLAFGAAMIGTAFAITLDFLQERGLPNLPRSLLAAALVAALVPVYMWRGAYEDLVTLRFLEQVEPGEFRNADVFDLAESQQAAAYMRGRTRPDETILIWGYESLTYYFAQRKAASRFQTTHPLIMRPPGGDLTPMQLGWRRIFLDEVERSAPAYVAVLTDDRWWWAPGERTSQELLEDFPEWKRIIEERYRLETEIGRFRIHRRIEPATHEP